MSLSRRGPILNISTVHYKPPVGCSVPVITHPPILGTGSENPTRVAYDSSVAVADTLCAPVPALTSLFHLTMRISTLSISLSLLAVCVSAVPLQPLLARRVPAVSAPSIRQGFERRQVSVASPTSVPSQCTSTCSPVSNEVSLVSGASHWAFLSPALPPRVGVTTPIPFRSVTAADTINIPLPPGMSCDGMLHDQL